MAGYITVVSVRKGARPAFTGGRGGQNVLVTRAGWWLTLTNASYLGIVKQYFRFRISLTLNSKCKLWTLNGTLSDEWGIKTLKLRRSQHQFSLLSNKFLTNLPLRIRSAIKLYLQVGIFSFFKFTNRSYAGVFLFSDRSQMTSKCGKNKELAQDAQPSESLMFLPNFDVFYDLLLDRRTATYRSTCFKW